MSCVAVFKIGDQEVRVNLESGPDSPLTEQEIIEALSKDPAGKQKLIDALSGRLYKESTVTPIKLSDLTKLDGLTGNSNIGFLREQFPEVNFPEGVDADILLVDGLKIGKQNIYGRVITSNGKELFILRNSAEDVQKLANFLSVRKQMEDQSFVFDENSKYQKNLEACLKERNKKKPVVSDTFSLILDFIYNRKKYDSMYFTDQDGKQESVYAYLSKINNIILQYSDRVVFLDQFVNTINQLRSHLDNNEGYISFDAIYGAIKQYHKDILDTLQITSLKGFKDFLNSSEPNEEFSKLFPQEENENRTAALLRTLFSAEPEFSWNYVRSTKNGVILKSSPKTINAKYGIEYDTIHTFDIVDNNYLGYKIYKFTDEDGNQKFIPSRGFLTEDSFSKLYDSIEAVQQFIQNSVSKQDIKKNSLLEFKYRTKLEDGWTGELDSFKVASRQSLTVGSIIESLNVPIDQKQEIYNQNERDLFKLDRQNYDTFLKIVNGWNISDELKNNIANSINTPEKIAVFLYKLNETLQGDRTNEQGINNVIDMINNATVNYYYIDSKTANRGMYSYRVIPTDPVQIDNYKKNKNTPVVQLMSAIGQVLNEQFGVTVNMLTSQEIKEQFPDIDANNTKAFVRDGNIYVNTTTADSSDPLHEFTHLILGILKSDPNLRGNYEQLMLIVSSTKEGKNLMNKLRDTYPDISQMDLMEETFVNLFSKYIIGELKPGFETTFTAVEPYMKDATKIVFNNNISDLRSFYGTSIDQIFRRFNSDVASLIGRKGIDFESTKQSRRISNWISEQIRNGEIKEKCYD